MRTYETTVYKFSELKEEAQKTAIENMRDTNIFGEWWDFVYEDLKRDMIPFGIEVSKIYFSGFASQGDGAMFEGHINDWEKLSSVIKISKGIKRLITDYDGGYLWKHEGHYYHENCISFDDDMLVNWHYYLGQNIKPKDEKRIDKALTEINKAIEEFVKSKCRELYEALEQQYDWLVSDEAVKETLLADDDHTEFLENGTKD